MLHKLTVQTNQKTEVLDLTDQLQTLVESVQSGIALFSVPHTTAALILSEDDAELREDIVKVATDWLADLRPFKHIRKNNPNTEAHILSATMGTSVMLAVETGKLNLGTYQRILLVELDGAKERQVHAKVISE